MDPKQIEGSAERAADRGREEDLGFTPPGPLPSLGDLGVVSGLVSEFASEVVAARRAYNEDKLTDQQALARIHDLAREYGAIVVGADDRYQSLPWNSVQRLGRRIQRVVPAIDGVTDPGELLFLTIGSSLIDLAAEHEEDRMSDEDVKAKVDEMLVDTVDLIMGVR